MKRIIWLLFSMFAMTSQAQIVDPVKFTSNLKMLDDTQAEIVFTASIENGWHVYATDLGDSGPIEATFNVTQMKGAELVGKLTTRGKVTEQYDPMFEMKLRFFEYTATFVQKIRFTKPDYNINGYLEYGACNDEMCLPPTQVEFAKSGKVDLPSDSSQEPTSAKEADTVSSLPADTTQTDSASQTNMFSPQNNLWTPIIDDLQRFEKEESQNSTSWWMIFMEGLLGGFLAILTPCVWPIIPMTVSFFLKRNKNRSKAIREALSYGVSIVVIYVLLGLLVTLLFGASALNALSTNAVFNVLFALLLIIFAASFFGSFEITLPSSWATKIDQKSESTTGLLSIFFMAFTLTLVSFSCTGPIIGFLLVAVSTQGSIIAPTIGMLGFAIALAIPFSLFALFPSLLKSAPKSGGWMNTVKVVLGFIELAFALKFLSVADLAYGWHLLDREVFISIWIVLFSLLGAYLLGWLRFPHDGERRGTNVPQFFLAMISLSFSVYMLPGLWGAPLKAISAFTPPMNTQDFSLYDGSVESQYTDYDLGMAVARAEGKPVIIDFTGFGCVNCRKMESKVWTDPQVHDLLTNDYVLISLYVDDKTALPEPVTVTETDGTQTVLRTVGDKWSYLERTLIVANTQPFYVLLDPVTGKPLNGLLSYNEDIEEYVDFLKKGLSNFKQSHD